MVERPNVEDPRYLERLIEHLDDKMSSLSTDMDMVKRIVSSTPTKGDMMQVSKAIGILEDRQVESWKLLKSNAARLVYITGVAGIVMGLCVKNASIQDLLPF